MDTFTAIETRRSIRKFDQTHKMSQAEKDRLIKLAMLSPTALNIQHWRFVTIEDPVIRSSIRAKAWDQEQITDASLLIVLCADLKAWEKDPERYWRSGSKRERLEHAETIINFYKGREEFQRDEAMRSCSMAAQTLMLSARAMGYDSCPMDGFDFDAVGEIIHLPNDHVITMIVAIGKADEKPVARSSQLPMSEVLIRDRF